MLPQLTPSPHQGQHSLPGPLPCPAFLCLAGGRTPKKLIFFSGRQCLGRPGREDERWDLFVVHGHSGVALPLVSHHCWLQPLPTRVLWAGGHLCIPMPTDKQWQALRAPHFCPHQVLAELPHCALLRLRSHIPRNRALGRDSHGHVPTLSLSLWDRQSQAP